jgi:molybdopterin-guanine dinucleotide biosynthesis protein
MYFPERIPARYDITIAHCIDVELEDVLETEDPADYVVINGFRCIFKRMKDADDYVNLHDKHVRDFLNNYFDIIR